MFQVATLIELWNNIPILWVFGLGSVLRSHAITQASGWAVRVIIGFPKGP